MAGVFEDLLYDAVPLPVVALRRNSSVRGLLEQIVTQAEELRNAANELGDHIRQACGGTLPANKEQTIGEALVHLLNPAAHRLLAGLQREPDRVEEADIAWQQVARAMAFRTGEQALAVAPPQAFLGRKIHLPGKASKPIPKRLALAEANYRRSVWQILPLQPASERSGV